MTPSIPTNRLSLRPLTKASARQVGWLRDPDVVRFSEQRHRDHDLSSQLDYIRSFGGSSHIWAIFEIESGEHIGNISARHDAPNNVADVGIMIGDTRFWRKSFGHEAWNGACAWLLSPIGGKVRKLEAGCMKSNVPMTSILVASGFKLEGERYNHFLAPGPTGLLFYGRSA